MATEADLIQKFKDLDIPVGADFEELIHAAFAGANLADLVNNYDSRITTVENDLSTKADDGKVVHDNHDGTEQLNGTKVQPFNKLSDTIGGRNLLTGTSDYSHNWLWDITPTIDTSQNPAILYYPSTTLTSGIRNIAYQFIGTILQPSTTYTFSFYAKGSGVFSFFCFPNVSAAISSVNGLVVNTQGSDCQTEIYLTSGYELYTITFTTLSSISGSKTFLLQQGYDSNYPTVEAYVYGMKLEQGSIATAWTPAPEDKADDSKVVHNSGNEEIGGQKTFDMAPIDKTTGNPYSTKSDIATAINAATANMADDSKVVHRDPSTGVVSDSTTFSDLKVGNGQQVASIDVASSEQEATDKASTFTAPGIVIY